MKTQNVFCLGHKMKQKNYLVYIGHLRKKTSFSFGTPLKLINPLKVIRLL